MKNEARQEAPDHKAVVTRRKAVALFSVGAAAIVLAACKSASTGDKEQKRNEGGY